MAADMTDQDVHIWHQRLGHCSQHVMKHLNLVHRHNNEVIDTPILDYETDNATNTKVHPDENVAHPTMKYEDSVNTLIKIEVTTINIPTHNQPVKRTSRNIKEPVWMKDYEGNKQSSIRHPIANSLSYDRVTACCKVFLSNLSEVGLTGAKPASTPILSDVRLTSFKYYLANGHTGDDVLRDITTYQMVVGKLLYATFTRPDISYVVQTLSQFMQSPNKSHQEAAIRVIKYLKGTVGQGVWLQSKPAVTLSCWCDSDWAACPNTRRSITGYVIKFGDSLMSWKSKKQQAVSRSSAEAKYKSMASTVSEVTWLLGLFIELEQSC
uniref:GAG-pre-integrase domain-containing protein n=1 Tax=Solanum lycopersicum TaxID=4081 RepID=A0A3Q7IGL5_SOLLC